MFPQVRLRRNRKYEWLRDLVSEYNLAAKDLIYPMFIIDGENKSEKIPTLPGVYRLSVDQAYAKVEEAISYGIKSIALFPVIDTKLKTDDAREAFNPDNLIARAIKKLRSLDIGIICDVALDPYTISGHDGIIGSDGDVDNDETVSALARQALHLANAGIHIVAPSDMMDGRVGAIRAALDKAGYSQILILSYSIKYASKLYGPFRDAVGSRSNLSEADKRTYQIDYRNSRESMREIEEDVSEGADIIMIKPGMLYLDLIYQAKQKFNLPIFAYQVSGEYAMIKIAAENGCFNFEKVMIESLISLKRAGATAILTYAAVDIAKILKNG